MSALLRLFLLLSCVLLPACSDEGQLTPLKTDAIILAFGDSLTHGTGAKPENSYPAQLEKRIHRKVINAGIPGEISAKGLRRLPSVLKTFQPDLVILFHGANDILRKMDLTITKSNLQKMIVLIQQSGAQVILLSVPQFSLFLSPQPLYSELASENSIPFLNDTLSEILRQPSLKSDYVHPNADGYAIMAEKVRTLIINNGGLRQSSN